MRVLIAFTLVIACGSAVAQYSGADLRRDVLSSNREQQIAAIYYVGGVIDQSAITYNYLKLTGVQVDLTVFFCLPSTVKLGDVFAVVKRRMETTEVELSEPAVTHITQAARAIWPCRE